MFAATVISVHSGKSSEATFSIICRMFYSFVAELQNSLKKCSVQGLDFKLSVGFLLKLGFSIVHCFFLNSV